MTEKQAVATDRASRARRPQRAVTSPEAVALRYNVRFLDPLTAPRLDRQALLPTEHVGHRLLVRHSDTVLDTLAKAARQHGLRVRVVPDDAALLADLPDLPVAVRVELLPDGEHPFDAPDAWRVLQTYRTLADQSQRNDVGLDHLMGAGLDIEGVPFVGGHGIGGVPFVGGHGVGGFPFVGGHGVGSASQIYALPGSGGRQPVLNVGAPPTATPGFRGRRPVVAILDTVVGRHPWFDDKGRDVVDRRPTVRGQLIGVPGDGGDGRTVDPFEGVLDDDAGHGTFVAGLVHQFCPEARILAVQVTRSSGSAPEGDLLRALWQLVQRQRLAQSPGGEPGQAIDVVNLSLGYYHEQPEDELFDSKLLDPLRELSRMGVLVVASAGNGATDRRMYPAAFTPFRGGVVSALSADQVPLLSVGALNPNRSVALFSNTGPWVTCYRPGAALVSAMPTDLDGGAQPAYRVREPGYGVREDIDPDNFRGGFAIWSGTSFAAPVLAGQLAATLVKQHSEHLLDDVSPAGALERAWAAVEAQTPLRRPGAAAPADRSEP